MESLGNTWTDTAQSKSVHEQSNRLHKGVPNRRDVGQGLRREDHDAANQSSVGNRSAVHDADRIGPATLLAAQGPDFGRIASIEVTPASLTLEVGESANLTARALDEDGNEVEAPIVYISRSRRNVSVTDQGVVEAYGPGRYTIVVMVPGGGGQQDRNDANRRSSSRLRSRSRNRFWTGSRSVEFLARCTRAASSAAGSRSMTPPVVSVPTPKRHSHRATRPSSVSTISET